MFGSQTHAQPSSWLWFFRILLSIFVAKAESFFSSQPNIVQIVFVVRCSYNIFQDNCYFTYLCIFFLFLSFVPFCCAILPCLLGNALCIISCIFLQKKNLFMIVVWLVFFSLVFLFGFNIDLLHTLQFLPRTF